MPAELPGFFWDESRNRYFPLSSRPPQKVIPRAVVDDHPTTRLKHRGRQNARWNVMETMRTTYCPQKRLRARHDLLCSQYSNTSRVEENKVPVFGRIKTFCSTNLNGQIRRFIGDSRGWLYTSTPLITPTTTRDLWVADLNLQPESEISSICISGSLCVATCFGPTAKIAVQDLTVPGRTSLLSLTTAHDIWSAHLQDNDLVLGVTKRAIYLPNIEHTMSTQNLETYSDVFAVRQHGSMIYAGCRNGSIIRFDKRVGKHGQSLYKNKITYQQPSSVLHLETLGDSQLLSSYMNGDLLTYDLRFTRETKPVVQYCGHRNTYTQRLGIALDVHQKFIFAAGEDQRIRGWSVHSGIPILPSTPGDRNNPFSNVFPGVVETIQVTVERENLCLWTACDQILCQFYLGQRSVV